MDRNIGFSKESPGIHSTRLGGSDMDLSIKSLGSDSDLGSQLEGDITVQGLPNVQSDGPEGDFNTLDEPILNTITRDVKAVAQKLLGALLPNSKNVLMKEWDLWGPLFLCTYIGLVLQNMGDDSNGYQFTELFVLVWIGYAVITYNFVFCSTATISTFQCVCVLGYSLGPLAIAVTLLQLMHMFNVINGTFFLRFIFICAAAAWSSFASTKIFGATVPEEKKIVLLSPVVVLYTLVALLILYHSGPSHHTPVTPTNMNSTN